MFYIQETSNFLNNQECENIVNIFKNNFLYFNVYSNETNHFTIKYDIREDFEERKKIIDFVKNLNMNLTLNYDQIVMWPNNSSMKLHKDGQKIIDNDFTAMCYLNNNYIGGRTFIENKLIENKIGKLVVFNSKNLMHAVELVTGTRLVYISWWKQNDNK
jgi:hypothetical protein